MRCGCLGWFESTMLFDALYFISTIVIIKLSKRSGRRCLYAEKNKEYIESWVHDIKTPLTAINLICENNKNDYTKKIQRETGIIENQVENVLYYARMEQVYKDYMIHSVNLKNVVLNSVRRNKLYFIQGKMQVNVEFDDIMVSTDEKWIEFLLNQIFLNAIKYRTNENAHIDITTNKQDKNIELIIEDNGIGIPKEDIGRIFEKGFTGSNGRRDIKKDNSTDYNISKKATGIGLYLCKNLCDKLDIGIRCESEEGRYTRMILTFPDSDYAKL
jgi:signal transduction histidine kinase